MPSSPSWSAFGRAFAFAALALGLVCAALILLADPYGRRVAPGRPRPPIMDLNQRYMYPQIVRSGAYDSAAFGTSTIRLLDPEQLNRLFGGRFANLGLNAGTPYEQLQLIDLFLRRVARPRTLILGLDLPWCEAEADKPAKRFTSRSFPPWLYDENPWNDLIELFNLRGLEIAARVVLNRLGRVPERIRADGFEVFTPPEASYDLARARLHIWFNRPERRIVPASPAVTLSATEAERLAMPALAWLDGALAKVPAGTEVILAFLPIHVAAQMQPESAAEALDRACKERVAALAAKRGATLVDFRRASPITTDDANYWDPLHMRLPVAARVAEALKAARVTGADAPDGFYRVMVRGRPD